jgi:hypothetical protein
LFGCGKRLEGRADNLHRGPASIKRAPRGREAKFALKAGTVVVLITYHKRKAVAVRIPYLDSFDSSNDATELHDTLGKSPQSHQVSESVNVSLTAQDRGYSRHGRAGTATALARAKQDKLDSQSRSEMPIFDLCPGNSWKCRRSSRVPLSNTCAHSSPKKDAIKRDEIAGHAAFLLEPYQSRRQRRLRLPDIYERFEQMKDHAQNS